jgi:DNA-binding transcriptional LysR family regulator
VVVESWCLPGLWAGLSEHVRGDRSLPCDHDHESNFDLLRGSLCWGHMPHHMVAEDLASGSLVELQRRAWHMRPLTFMISQRRGYPFSECETRLVTLLGGPERSGGRN